MWPMFLLFLSTEIFSHNLHVFIIQNGDIYGPGVPWYYSCITISYKAQLVAVLKIQLLFLLITL